MEAYLHLVLSLKAKFPVATLNEFLRSENNHVDSLANLASATKYQLRQENPLEHIPTPSIQRPDREILRLDTSLGWRDPIIA